MHTKRNSTWPLNRVFALRHCCQQHSLCVFHADSTISTWPRQTTPCLRGCVWQNHLYFVASSIPSPRLRGSSVPGCDREYYLYVTAVHTLISTWQLLLDLDRQHQLIMALTDSTSSLHGCDRQQPFYVAATDSSISTWQRLTAQISMWPRQTARQTTPSLRGRDKQQLLYVTANDSRIYTLLRPTEQSLGDHGRKQHLYMVDTDSGYIILYLNALK